MSEAATGITRDLMQAGRYSRAEALDICRNALPGHVDDVGGMQRERATIFRKVDALNVE